MEVQKDDMEVQEEAVPLLPLHALQRLFHKPSQFFPAIPHLLLAPHQNM